MSTPITAATWGIVYLLHLSSPLGNLQNPRAQASHYIGFCFDLAERLAAHRGGWGSKMLAAAVARGITFEVVATWRAPLGFEKYLKRRKSAPKLCPICCQAHGWRHRPIVPATQLELPLDFSQDFPPAPALAIDYLEIVITRSWRQASPALAMAAGDDWDRDLL